MDSDEVDEVFEEITTSMMDHDHLAEVARQTRRIRRVWLLRQIAMGVFWAGCTVVFIVTSIALVVLIVQLTLTAIAVGW